MIRRQGISASRCGMKAKECGACSSGTPLKSMVPASGRSAWVSSRSTVDFPEPEGPTIETNSPSATASEISPSTFMPSKDFEILCSSTIASLIGAAPRLAARA
jgi:hypothetical protein